MKNTKSGVTLINLVVMIIIMIVLISITGYYSLENVKNGYYARQKKEFANVVDYVSILRAKLLIGEFDVPLLEPISDEALMTLASFLSPNVLTAIIDVNSSDMIEKQYKYFYITPVQLADKKYSDGNINVKEAKYNYIVNFYTGTVIALYEDEDYEIFGIVKGLPAILNDLEY
ncbi:MAG: hypothetical protein K6E74_04980 [Bacilli bacterium]|nr:hypothetical protein [Bacilli bacterium]